MPLLYHWYVNPVPVNEEVKVLVEPWYMVVSDALAVTLGFTVTLTVCVLDSVFASKV